MRGNDIVVILFDQLSAKWYEKASELGYTPNLDAIKGAGTYFSRCYSSSPMCVPARASMLTGLSPRQHGNLFAGYTLDTSIQTYMDVLLKHGYNTAGIGKFHISPEHSIKRPDYTEYGFQCSIESQDYEKNNPFGFMNHNNPSTWGYEHHKEGGFYCAVEDKEKTQTHFITQKSLEFMDMISKEENLAMLISYVNPHPPINPPKEYLEMVDEDVLPEMIKPTWMQDPDVPQEAFMTHSSAHPYGADDLRKADPEKFWKEARKYYFADIIHLDEQIGKIMRKLDERKGWKNTKILITSDHGEMLGDHDLNGKMGTHYDACVRIPMIINTPKEQKPLCEALVQSEDVYYTILDMAGLKEEWYDIEEPLIVRSAHRKDENLYRTFSFSAPKRYSGMPWTVLPFCYGDEDEGWRDEILIETYTGWHAPLGWWTRTIVNDRYRYSYFPGAKKQQLFDLYDDPDEINNLAGNKEYEDIVHEMRLSIIEKSTWSEYPMSVRNIGIRNLV